MAEVPLQNLYERLFGPVSRLSFSPSQEMQEGILGNGLLPKPVLDDLAGLGQGVKSFLSGG